MTTLEEQSMRRQQIILGWLCTILPFASIGFGLIGGISGTNYPEWYFSISATYYANSKLMLIGLLFTTGVYFWAYKGYDTVDKWITNLCSIFSFMIIAFPCKTVGLNSDSLVGILCLPMKLSNIIHCTSAILLYTCFAFMMMQFRKTSGNMTDQKKIRNVFYLVFTIILACCGVFTCVKAAIPSIPGYTTIILETIIQLSFGFAWLIKAGAFKMLNDK